MVDTTLNQCEDGSDEHLMFCGAMEELEALCGAQFSCFLVTGYSQVDIEGRGTEYQAKIKIADEGDTPFIHVKMMKPLPNPDLDRGTKVEALKKGQAEGAEFNFGEDDIIFNTCLSMPVDEPQAAAEDQQPQGQSISGMVNQQEVSMIMDMGFSKNVAEKAVFMVQGAGVERALEWIDNNRNEPDFEEPLLIVGQDSGPKKESQFAGMTKAEKEAKIRELQAQARAKRQKEEAANRAENERNRARMDKELAAAKRIADEQEMVKAMELRKLEKKEEAREKARMRELLERDRRERFGGSAAAATEEAKKQKSPAELVENGIKMVKTLYTEIRAPGVAKTCLKTVHTFIKNIQGSPDNEKFQKVNLENAAVQKRVAKINGGLQILKAVGFKPSDDGTCLIM